ncbi:MAG: hypothetical protein A3I06_05215 [Candidatus Lindowbacteria bacterium RIFCSPLOWO2_02_FULL_62_12]|nr:MAG: hypothetical protein A3I06_05215 [Candidatus Lindowbacteria bacterium RIFCSPLOWO2_02_FULL_62_12]
MKAATLIIEFISLNWSRILYCVGSAMRRSIPPAPTRKMGQKVALKKMKVIQKWILPSVSLYRRPNSFGYQK